MGDVISFGNAQNPAVIGQGEFAEGDGNVGVGELKKLGSIFGEGGSVSFSFDEFMTKAAETTGKSGEDLLSWMMDMRFKTMQATIDNLKPSDAEIELRERKLEEMKELRQLIEDKTVDFNQKLLAFENSLDTQDVALFWEKFNEESPAFV